MCVVRTMDVAELQFVWAKLMHGRMQCSHGQESDPVTKSNPDECIRTISHALSQHIQKELEAGCLQLVKRQSRLHSVHDEPPPRCR